MTNTINLPADENLSERKDYKTPEFQVFGNIREITQNVLNGGGKNDNQGSGNQKTTP